MRRGHYVSAVHGLLGEGQGGSIALALAWVLPITIAVGFLDTVVSCQTRQA